MQRLTQQIDWLGNGTNAGFERNVVYNARGQIDTDTSFTRRTDDTYTSVTVNQYGSGSFYALGSVTSSTTVNTKGSGTALSTVATTNTYAWYDGAVQSSSNVVTDYPSNGPSDTNHNTTFSLGATGQLTSAYIGDGRPRTVTFTTDMAGQVLRRDEADNNTAGGDPHEIFYRFGNKQLGYTGNNGTLETDYAASIVNRTATPGTGNGAFRLGAVGHASHADFGMGLDPVNSYGQGGSAGNHIVRAGDTLHSIAANVWGDAQLWYLIAEANGIGAGTPLVAGQSLIIPNKQVNSHNSAGTFRPYDAAQALGDTSPNAIKPAKQAKCAVIGQILMVIVAVAVTALTAGAGAALAGAAPGILSGMGAMAAGTGLSTGALMGIGAVAGAAGSIASQGVGMATGLQSKMNWGGVAMGAISGAVSAGVGASGMFANVGSKFAQGALNAGLSSTLSQGIGVATGLQKKFDFAGVAGSALAGGISARLSRNVQGLDRNASLANILTHGGISAVSGFANAGARSLITGTSFGDNLMAALPDIIGGTIGNLIAGSVTQHEQVTSRALARGLADEVTFESGLTREGRVIVRDLREALETRAENGPAATPEERIAQSAELDQRVEAVLGLARTPAERARVADYRRMVFPRTPDSRIGDVQVNGDYDNVEYWASRHIDNTGIWVGEQREALSQNFNQFLDEHPGARIGFNIASMGLTVAGGPVRYGLNWALNRFEGTITNSIAGGYENAGWEGADPAHGGQGVVFAGKVLLGGAGALAVRPGRVRPVNGRSPMNSMQYAGTTMHFTGRLAGRYPHGVPFSGAGYPDFSRYSIHNVRITLTGSDRGDVRAANAAAGLRTKPRGYTWHHNQDVGYMQLVPTALHRAVSHTGGVARSGR